MNIKHFFYWAAGATALFALAAPFPDLATILVVILIVGVGLTHYQDYLSYINAAAPASVQKKG